MPAISPSGINSSRLDLKPTTSALTVGAFRPPLRISQISPTCAAGPMLSTTSPITCVTKPLARTVSRRVTRDR